MTRLLMLFGLIACGTPQTFEERAMELEAETPVDCGEVTITCGPETQVVPIVECMREHLAAGTGARALRPQIDRETYAYAIDGELVVLDRVLGADVVWRHSERHCRAIGWHGTTSSCWSFDAYECD